MLDARASRPANLGPALALAFLLAASACGAKNPNFCEGTAEECSAIDAPSMQSCTGSGPNASCPASAPICTDGFCGGACTADSQCAMRTDINRVCHTASGDCGQCDEDDVQASPGSAEDECRAPGMEICDADTHACRACREHAECASGVCDAGTCVAPTNIIYMKADGTDDPACGGTPDTGCSTLHVAIGKLTTTRRYIVMAASATAYRTRDNGGVADFNDKNAHVIGYGASLLRGFTGDVVLVRGTSNVIIEGLSITNAIVGSGIKTQESAALELRRADVRSCNLFGVDHTSSGMLRVIRSVITRNAGGGINIANGSFTVVNNMILDNGNAGTSEFGGIRATTSMSGGILEFNTIHINHSLSPNPDSVICTGGNHTARNNILFGGPDPRAQVNVGSTCTFTYTLVGPITDLQGEGNMPVGAASAFKFKSATDLHVESGTIATGKAQATNLISEAMVDVDGESRQAGGASVEVGADEIP